MIKMSREYELLELFYELDDGIAWSVRSKTATFRTFASAGVFKQATPDWQVYHMWTANIA